MTKSKHDQKPRQWRLDDFHYELPEELIAQHAISPRDASRLLVVHRQSGTIEHRQFRDIVEYVAPHDMIVLNDTRVMPCRLRGRKLTGGAVEAMLLKKLPDGAWEALVKPARRLSPGTPIDFGPRLQAVMEGEVNEGTRAIRLQPDGDEQTVLHEVGHVPLPPYITGKLSHPERYQTVFAREEGSAAAPTAGLHFTDNTFQALRQQKVRIGYVTLHVGVGTFRPVKTEYIHEHVMHTEHFAISQETADDICATKQRGKRIVAVGTTTCRTLESSSTAQGRVQAGAGETDLFIYPGYKFKVVDALLTNFHLPRSSLLMLVAGFAEKELMDYAYEEAIKKRYRFYSFGDAMLIL